MRLKMVQMHLQMAKMHLQMVKVRLKMVKKHSYNYFVVNLPLSDERSQL